MILKETLKLIADEHTLQVRELTLRIGELCIKVNERDARIERLLLLIEELK